MTFAAYLAPYLWKVTPPSSPFTNCFPSHLLSLFNLKRPCLLSLSLSLSSSAHPNHGTRSDKKRKAAPSSLSLSKKQRAAAVLALWWVDSLCKSSSSQLTQAKEGIKMVGKNIPHSVLETAFFWCM